MRVEGCAPLQIQVGANSGEGNSREPSTPRTCGRTDRPAPIAACLWRIAHFVEIEQFASHRSPYPRRGAAGGLTQPKARGENGALARARAKSWSAAGREWCRRKKMRTQEAPPCGSSAGSLAGTGVNESAALAGLYYRELYGGCFYEKTGAAEPRVICIEPSKTLKRILRASPNGRTTHG